MSYYNGFNPTPSISLGDMERTDEVFREYSENNNMPVHRYRQLSSEEIVNKYMLDTALFTKSEEKAREAYEKLLEEQDVKNKNKIDELQRIAEEYKKQNEELRLQKEKELEEKQKQLEAKEKEIEAAILRERERIAAEQEKEAERKRLEEQQQREAELKRREAELKEKEAAIERERKRIAEEAEHKRLEEERINKEKQLKEQARLEEERKKQLEAKRKQEEKQRRIEKKRKENDEKVKELERIKQEKLKELNKLLDSKNKQSKPMDKLDKTLSNIEAARVEKSKTNQPLYDELTADALIAKVKEFALKNDLNNKIISRKSLDKEFGVHNINRLITKAYLIQLGEGVTFGNE